jgi:hypothetical protein
MGRPIVPMFTRHLTKKKKKKEQTPKTRAKAPAAFYGRQDKVA